MSEAWGPDKHGMELLPLRPPFPAEQMPPSMFEDLFNYLYHQNETGGIPLKGTGIAVALALLISHGYALLRSAKVQSFLKAFPRNYKWGVILLSIDFIWGMVCMAYMDMGEFYHLRKWFLLLIPISFVLVLIYVREFLSVRALGALLLLVGGIVLQAAFLQPPLSRLLLPALAYVWIIAGMYFVGMPYLMRDWIGWLICQEARWKLAVYGGIGYGALVLMAALLWW